MQTKDTVRHSRAEETHAAVQFEVQEDITGEYNISRDEKAAQHKTVLSVKKLRSTAVKCLNEMMTDMSLKPADRLNAIKAVLDYTGKQLEEKERERERERERVCDAAREDSTLHVIFDNMPREYAE